jgi:hypothetical protein
MNVSLDRIDLLLSQPDGSFDWQLYVARTVNSQQMQFTSQSSFQSPKSNGVA